MQNHYIPLAVTMHISLVIPLKRLLLPQVSQPGNFNMGILIKVLFLNYQKRSGKKKLFVSSHENFGTMNSILEKAYS